MDQATYRRYVEEVWNAHDPAAMSRYFTPDVRVHAFTPGIEPTVGLANLQALAASLFRGFPDVRFTLDGLIAQPDQLAARLFLEGTHQGEFAGMPPTGRRMKVVDFAMYRIVDGRFTDVWSLVDMLGMREQLGFSA